MTTTVGDASHPPGASDLRALLVRDASAPPAVADVIMRDLTVNRDPRGTLTELLRADWSDLFGDTLPFAQLYTSTTAPGVARDEDRWHVHRHQTDRFFCLSGRIVVPIADARPASPTHGRLMLVELAAGPDHPAPLVVTIPPGTLHGLLVTSDTPATLLNLPTRLYDPADEGRIPFADAGIALPDGRPFSYDLVRVLYR
jgi:dTDP-4-dehydrorhamnose 3,5-epimerase-like enzyme